MARRPSRTLLVDAVALPSAPPAEPAPPPQAQTARRAKSRDGKRGVAFWLDAATFEVLRQIIFDERSSVQALMEECVDHGLRARGRHPMAQKSRPMP